MTSSFPEPLSDAAPKLIGQESMAVGTDRHFNWVTGAPVGKTNMESETKQDWHSCSSHWLRDPQ
jgi:hypothetical protein